MWYDEFKEKFGCELSAEMIAWFEDLFDQNDRLAVEDGYNDGYQEGYEKGLDDRED